MARGGSRPNTGGKRPGSGRKKGSPDVCTEKANTIAEKAAGDGPLPLEVLLTCMREAYAAKRYGEACSLAKEAAPYLHKKKGVEVDKNDLLPPIVTQVVINLNGGESNGVLPLDVVA